MKVCAIVVAAGKSERMGGVDKIEYDLGGVTVLERSAAALARNELISELVVVVRAEKLTAAERMFARGSLGKPVKVTSGGETRFLSVQNGIAAASEDTGYYCIHDAARPFVSEGLISRTILAARSCGAAVGGVPVNDTIKIVDGGGFSAGTLERSSLRAVGTPQVFEAGLYRAAAAAFPGKDALDDCEVVERYGRPVAVIEGEVSNIKITVPEDIKKTEFGVKGVRIGHGYDAHRLTEGRKLILGGVRIPHGAGLLGHSDADVLSHAVIDALLGAAALGDIGALFPDTDARFKDADSLSLLREAAAKVRDAGYAVGNIDAAVICQRPKIAGFIGRMRENIAEAAGTDAGNVSVKATTEEGMGFTGELKGISAHAAALLIKM